jgi:hypothetical protein
MQDSQLTSYSLFLFSVWGLTGLAQLETSWSGLNPL